MRKWTQREGIGRTKGGLSVGMAQTARDLYDRVVELRRRFHMNPELAMEELQTAAHVTQVLRSEGMEVRTGVGKTGVVGLLRGRRPGPTVALRADMDALPMTEETGAPYASKVSERMHACGHDAHTANLLGVSMLLNQITKGGERLAGNIKFLFQPAEEGSGGARPMIEDGALTDPDVDAVFGLHVSSELPTGTIAVKEGVASASSDTAYIRIVGQGGHGAHPEKTVDSIVVASHFITALQTVVSREIKPNDAAVVSVGRIIGGYRSNIIAPRVELEATVRTLDPEVRASMRERIERILAGTTSAFRADYELDYAYGYPSQHNDEEMVKLVRAAARSVTSSDAETIPDPSMGAEDFGYFSSEVPGCFFALGVRNETEGLGVYPAHHPCFDIDERALYTGMQVMAQVALDYLERAFE